MCEAVNNFARLNSLQVPVEDLRDVDQELDSLSNLNTPADYLSALEQAGFQAPDEVVARLT